MEEVMKKERISFIFTVIFLIFTTISSAYDFYIDAEKGSNFNNGSSPEEAWQTITHALNNISAASKNPVSVFISQGNYDTNLGEQFPIKMKAPHL